MRHASKRLVPPGPHQWAGRPRRVTRDGARKPDSIPAGPAVAVMPSCAGRPAPRSGRWHEHNHSHLTNVAPKISARMRCGGDCRHRALKRRSLKRVAEGGGNEGGGGGGESFGDPPARRARRARRPLRARALVNWRPRTPSPRVNKPWGGLFTGKVEAQAEISNPWRQAAIIAARRMTHGTRDTGMDNI